MIYSQALNDAVLAIAHDLMPEGFDVSPAAPQTFEALKAHYDKTGRVMVWDGASGHTIFGVPRVNHAFRAWHDYHHLTSGADFTKEGEEHVCLLQCNDLEERYPAIVSDYLSLIVQAEIIGQFKYQEKHGGFPYYQYAFVRDYLLDPSAAIGQFARSIYGVSYEAS